MAHLTESGLLYTDATRDRRFDNRPGFVSTANYWYNSENEPSRREAADLVENILSGGVVLTVPEIAAICGRCCHNGHVNAALGLLAGKYMWVTIDSAGRLKHGVTLTRFEPNYSPWQISKR